MDMEETRLSSSKCNIYNPSLLYTNLASFYFTHPPSTGPTSYPIGLAYGSILASLPFLVKDFTGSNVFWNPNRINKNRSLDSVEELLTNNDLICTSDDLIITSEEDCSEEQHLSTEDEWIIIKHKGCLKEL